MSVSPEPQTSIGGEKTKIHLFVPFYQSANAVRQQELLSCLQKNLKNDLIDRIFIVPEDPFQEIESHDKITVVQPPVKRRQTFLHMFSCMNDVVDDSCVSIVSNADIYFEEDSLRLLVQNQKAFREKKKCFALSRYDYQKDGTLKPFLVPGSQDVWIFFGPITLPSFCDFCLGIPHCDHRIAAELHKAGYIVYNPSKTLKVIHLHLSAQRTYTNQTKGIAQPWLLVSPCEFKEVGRDAEVVKFQRTRLNIIRPKTM